MIRRNVIRSLAALATVAVLGGCGGSPLIGRWSTTQGTGTATQKLTITFNGDGTAAASFTGSGDCTGTLNISGARWTATATQVTSTGTTTCSGTITCMVAGQSITIDCSMAGSQPTGMPENYSINGNTLTLGSTMYTRE